MKYTVEKLREDLAVFADLGTDAPVITTQEDKIMTRLIREGVEVNLVFRTDGHVIERSEGEERRHLDLRALLASPTFANLGKWASSQQIQLKERLEKETIPIYGQLGSSNTTGNISVLDNALAHAASGALDSKRDVIILVDGPAGIGKTSLIRQLCFNRAINYRSSQKPIVLHVESRGRMLQNITDLTAFSLQTLRVPVTYDQIPSLVRNGLVILAIDGFDELGDPNGYELAWAQVNDLILDCRGSGAIILAGRETFIGKDRLISALTAVDPKYSVVDTFSLCPIAPETAKGWLASAGWPASLLTSDVTEPLFEMGSYALRPFFLAELAREGVYTQIAEGQVDDLLSFLVRAMIEREAKKFGKDVDTVSTEEQRQEFIRKVMEEAARDLAENQSDAVAAETLVWLAEIVASEMNFPAGMVGILKNRVQVIAFLTNDDRRGYRRFSHDQILNYFLSHVTINAIAAGEVPKYVRRNIIGPEFLENFCGVVQHLQENLLNSFVDTAVSHIDSIADFDRARRNLASLVIAICSVFEPSRRPRISSVSLDEAYLTSTVSPIQLDSVIVGQLYAKETDFREIEFQGDCFIASLIADSSTIPSVSMPTPSRIHLNHAVIADPTLIMKWCLLQQYWALPEQERNQTLEIDRLDGRTFSLIELLLKVARNRAFWIKEDDEDRATRRIINDPHWGKLRELMKKHDLLLERRGLGASGRPAMFYHVKNRPSLLLLDAPPEEIRPFLDDVFFEAIRIQSQEALR